MIEATYEPHK